MYDHRLAYRHHDGTVEGFKGSGPTRESAKEDATVQIIKKLIIINREGRPAGTFAPDRVIVGERGLTKDELVTVRRDWASKVRY